MLTIHPGTSNNPDAAQSPREGMFAKGSNVSEVTFAKGSNVSEVTENTRYLTLLLLL